MYAEIDADCRRIIEEAEAAVSGTFRQIEEIGLLNQAKVLSAFKEARVGTHHFTTSTGYGYNDLGRETLEQVFATVFDGESALVRQQIASGTHAINCCLSGILRPGDEVLFATGLPYDTLRTIVGLEGAARGNLSEFGIEASFTPLQKDGRIDLTSLIQKITPRTKIVAFQRSCGYETRPAISISQLAQAFSAIKQEIPATHRPVLFVDNCYGEFTEAEEPTTVGADLIAGSLIKNPGGGVAPAGGYIVGRKDLVDLVAARLYAPGLGGEVGPSLTNLRLFFQGLFDAPHRVTEMVKAAVLFARVFQEYGFPVLPAPTDQRSDVIQRIDLADPERLISLCRIIQEVSPVESYLQPEPGDMPGYSSKVIMAAGTFIAGATSELSADAPLKPPYSLFIQGALSYLHAKLALGIILTKLKNESLLPRV
ncbi:MAG TPA: hypothetical protein GXZ36_06240 [Firmicutes bacterium]|nr:hypothetical protein [Bacillota bacterium]